MVFPRCVLRASRTTSSEYAVFTEASFFSKSSFAVIPSLLLLLLLLESEEAVAEVLLPLPLEVARLVMLAADPEEELLALLVLLARYWVSLVAVSVFSSIFTSLSSPPSSFTFSAFFSML